MKLYFIIVNNGFEDDSYEYHSSIAKAKKSRARLNKMFKIDNAGGRVSIIFKTDITPTKKGIIRFLNHLGAGTPIE